MKKLALIALAAASVAVLSLSSPQEARAGDACVRKEFKTTLVKDACTKGGQGEAKKVMKKFLSTAKAKNPEVKDCKSCHTTLSPDYKLTPNALEMFKKSGGK
ncbi:MAG TPA: hypothetical protein VNM90_15140 [Haliangium sp.]|nr:hypothetical protein [Haliangium sp.]